MEKEYAVIVRRDQNISEVEADIIASTGSGPIPNRSVEVANPRIGSTRITHFMLTDEEANELSTDPRILAVEIPPDQRDDIEIGLNSRQAGNYWRGTFNSANDLNWGLRRCIDATNQYGTSTTISGDYLYTLTGAGVDIVIQDSGIQPGHPEWEDENGVTRLVQHDWYGVSGIAGTQNANHYRDRDGHGTHCAGIAAGKTYGWAKHATIYSQKLAGLELIGATDGTGIPVADAFDSIRLWHNNKVSGKPTVVNMSWGYRNTSTVDPSSGTYRGTPWTFTTQTDAELFTDYGIVTPNGDGNRTFPAQNAFADAEVEDMIDAGIHVVIAAGNDSYKADVSTGTDWNNFVSVSGISRLYHRPSSPYSDRAFNVGNISYVTNGGTDQSANSSKKGPGVNIWAPGTEIMSASSNEADSGYTTYDYPNDSSYKIMKISGTSMAAPQIAGLAALHLQANSLQTPEQLVTLMTSVSKSVIYETANNDSDYDNTRSILGSPNRMMFSRYGVERPYRTNGSMTFTNSLAVLNEDGPQLETNAWLDDNGTNVAVSSIVSGIAIQVNAVIASNPATPFNIQGRLSGATTTVSAISANTGTVLEIDVNNSFGFQLGEGLNIIA